MEPYNLGQVPFVQFGDAVAPTSLGQIIVTGVIFGLIGLIAAAFIAMAIYDIWWKYEGAPLAPQWFRRRFKGLHRDDWLHYLTRIVLQDLAEWDIRGYDTTGEAFWLQVNTSRASIELASTADNDPSLWLSGHALMISIFRTKALEPYKKYLTVDMIAARALETAAVYTSPGL